MFLRFFSPDDGAPQGGAPASDLASQGEALAGLQRLLERQGGDSGRVAELLYRENYELRERARQLSERLPAQGAVVLDAARAIQPILLSDEDVAALVAFLLCL
ncbi:hypothetical protein [Candidatus Viridilinea mediisalina]|uniref:Uncharacterized protein n=1 Tax=Candidatus Viridilinea mediisalina TaxID=2024553 RepID=A0A2A6RHD7_9CHLR|nr:hypothetical protein [Candidatus Viridilinea mediisalina]PDW02288.1 hypothetical protein CJ255_14765 [Candidatus Viridilinea mediisalina]